MPSTPLKTQPHGLHTPHVTHATHAPCAPCADGASPPAGQGLHVLIAGAGWAGLAAAVAAVQRGWRVTLLEAAREPGGRARQVALADGTVLDCGQHIMIGAYRAALDLMRTVGADPDAGWQRLPLDLRTPDGVGLHLPPASAVPQWDVLRGVLRARGWSHADRARLLWQALRWQMQGFRCQPDTDVATLCRPLGPVLMQGLITPLCISAFNSAPSATSAHVFLRVLRDALLQERGGADVLIARSPLGDMLAQPAVQWLRQHGADVRLGQRLQSVRPLPPPEGGAPLGLRWQWYTAAAGGTGGSGGADAAGGVGGMNGAGGPGGAGAAAARPAPSAPACSGMDCDAVLLACPAWEAARIVAQLHQHQHALQHNTPPILQPHALSAWCQQADTLTHMPIATLYAWCPAADCTHLPAMQALHDPAARAAQFVFHHPQRQCQQDGQTWHLLAFVASVAQQPRAELMQAIDEQARQQLGLHHLRPLHMLVEKRATFICQPGLQRPAMTIAPGLLACADYVQGPYPATLEGAVRNGQAAIAAVQAAWNATTPQPTSQQPA